MLTFSDLYSARNSLLQAARYLLDVVNTTSNASKYEKLLQVQLSIPYLLKSVEQWMTSIAGQAPNLPNREDLKDVMNHSNIQCKSLKLK